MALSFTVTRGTSLSPNQPVTRARLHLLGLPSISFSGSVATGDLADGAVTPAKVTPGAYFYGLATGGGAAYVLTLSPALTAYANGVQVWWKAPTTSAGDSNAGATLDVNNLGAKGLYWRSGQAIKAGEIRGDDLVLVAYNSSRNSGAGGWDVLSVTAHDITRYGTTAGSANAQTLTFGGTTGYPTVKSLGSIEGLPLLLLVGPGLNNTGPATLAVDGLAATNILKFGGASLAPGDLVDGLQYLVCYDGSAFQLLGNTGHAESEYVATDSGTATAYAIAPVPAYTTLAELTGRSLRFKPANTNTGPATLAVSGLAATSIRKYGGTPLSAGDIKASQTCEVTYDGTYFILCTPAPPAAGKAWVKFDGTGSTANINVTPTGNQVTVTHGMTAATTLENVMMGVLGNTGTPPTGLTKGTHYYLHVVDANTLTFHTSAAGALDGTSDIVALSGAGSGTVTLYSITPSVRYNVAGVVPQVSAGGTRANGDYYVYFVNQFSTANYVILATANAFSATNVGVVSLHNSTAPSAGSFRLYTENNGGSAQNLTIVNVACFGTLT